MMGSRQGVSDVLRGVLAAVFIAYLVMTMGCASIEKIWDRSDKDCKIEELEDAGKQLDKMVQQKEIRPDQAEARKNDLQREWDRYERGDTSCERFRDKVEYHLSN